MRNHRNATLPGEREVTVFATAASTPTATAHQPRLRRRIRKLAVVAAAALTLLAASPGAAYAYVPAGSSSQYKGPGISFGSVYWDNSTGVMTWLKVQPQPPFASNQCLISIFDWRTSGGHFDSRQARSCNDDLGFYRSSYDSGQGRTLTAMQKFGVCYGPRNATNTAANLCMSDWRGDSVVRTGSGSEEAVGPNTNLPNNCARSWRVEAGSDTVVFHDGGIPYDCFL
jgi:hypothetical protein